MFLLPRKRRALFFGTPPTQGAPSSSTELLSPPTRQIEGLSTPYSTSTPFRTLFNTPSTQVATAAAVAPLRSAQPPAPIHLNATSTLAAAGTNSNGLSTPRSKKTYACRVCGFVLATAFNRLRHERSKHAGQVPESLTSTEVNTSQQPQQSSGAKRSAALAFNESKLTLGGPASALPSRSSESDLDQPGYYGPVHHTELRFQGYEVDPQIEIHTSAADSASDPEASDELAAPLSSESMDMELDMMDPPAIPQVNHAAEEISTGEGEQSAVEGEGEAATATESASTSPVETSDKAINLLAAYEPAPLLQDTQLQAACLPFLQWMCQPPITQVEALIKARRVKVITQLQPIKLNLRFIFGLLLDVKVITELELQALTRLAVCQALGAALEKREVGSGRIHAIFLLVKKVLVYLSSCESTKKSQFISPATQESYMYVESICSDSSHRRKQEARNRAMLGVQTSKLLHQSQPTRGLPALPANAFTMPSLQGNIEIVASKPVTSPPLSSTAPLVQVIPSIAAADMEPSSNELTGEELKSVAFGSLEYLKLRDSAYYMHHLVTATFCLGLAPRSQVLKQLRIGSSFVKEADGRYWVKMLAELNKNGKPTVFALPLQLTEPFDYYLESVRPALLQQSGQEHDYVFFKKNGTAPRTDFSELTALATQQLIQRPVNAHAFRSAVITAFYETGATQGDMDVLANIMAHDSATARTYYFKPQMAKAAVSTNDRMLQVLNLGIASDAVPSIVS